MLQNIILCHSIESSNDSVRRYPLGTVLVANAQSKGRGRHGKSWFSPLGGLYFSYKTQIPDDFSLGLIPVLVGVALYKALEDSGFSNVLLKWPNDLINNEQQKLAGILVENVAQSLIIGIGVNLQQINFEGSANLSLNGQEQRLWLLRKIIQNINFFQGLSTEEIISTWNENTINKKGTFVKAKLPNESQIEGKVCHLNNNGELWIELADGSTQSLVSAVVSGCRPSI